MDIHAQTARTSRLMQVTTFLTVLFVLVIGGVSLHQLVRSVDAPVSDLIVKLIITAFALALAMVPFAVVNAICLARLDLIHKALTSALEYTLASHGQRGEVASVLLLTNHAPATGSVHRILN